MSLVYVKTNNINTLPKQFKKDCTAYYCAERKSDVSGANTGIKYWTYGATHQGFILFSNASNALAGLPD